MQIGIQHAQSVIIIIAIRFCMSASRFCKYAVRLLAAFIGRCLVEFT